MKIDFSFESDFGHFSDALDLPDDHSFTDAEIESMKKQRFDNWIAVVTAPPVEAVEPQNPMMPGAPVAPAV